MSITTEKQIKVMQAFLDGKTIECRKKTIYDIWQRTASPDWDWVDYEYRVKKEPRVFYANEYPGHIGDFIYYSKEEADRIASDNRIKVIKLVEVLDE